MSGKRSLVYGVGVNDWAGSIWVGGKAIWEYVLWRGCFSVALMKSTSKINLSHVVRFGENGVYVWTDVTKDPDLYTATNCKDFAYLEMCFVEWCYNEKD